MLALRNVPWKIPKGKKDGFYEFVDEEEYFAHADECDFFITGYRKQSEGEWGSKHHMSRSQRGRYTSYNTYTCNVCGKANGRRKTPFCPHCGAKMKGGAE